jgi:hypothetical protein
MQAIMTLLAYLIARLSEVSTANGVLLWIAAQVHMQFNPAFNTALAQAIAAIAAAALFLVKDQVFTAAPKKVAARFNKTAA